MVKEIKILDKTNILGKEVQVLEGGFGKGQKVLTDKMIAEIHEVKAIHIREIINNNINRFKKDIDYKNLKGIVDTDTLEECGYSKQAIAQANNLYLLSERGYAKIIKIMDSDGAWEVHDILMDNYFSMRKDLGMTTGNKEVDLFTQLMSASMSAINQVLNENMRQIKEDLHREVLDTRNIINEQEIKHYKQLEETREMIGFKSRNTNQIAKLLKAKLSDLKGYQIIARDDYHYQLAKVSLFNKYGYFKWEDFPISKYNEVHADIDGIEDLDYISFN